MPFSVIRNHIELLRPDGNAIGGIINQAFVIKLERVLLLYLFFDG